MAHPEYGPVHSKKMTRLSIAIKLARQILLLIVVAVLLVLFLIVGELLFKDIGFDWSESLLVKMIIERRSLAP